MEPTKEFDGGGGGEGKRFDEEADQSGNRNKVKRAGRRGAGTGAPKGKSCTGYLYYSTVLKTTGKNPRCIGLPRTLPSVPDVVEKAEEHSTEDKSNFYYACAGYSMFAHDPLAADKKDSKKLQFPVCLGLELLVNTRHVPAPNAPSPAPVHHRQQDEIHPRPPLQTPKPPTQLPPTQLPSDDFLTRFTRNANLVASGVARNMKRVGNQIKDTVDDIFFPFRRPPK